MISLIVASAFSIGLIFIYGNTKHYRLSLGNGSIITPNVYYSVSCLILIFFAGLRTSYNDTLAYKASFLSASDRSINAVELLDNPIFRIFTIIIRRMTDNYHTYFLLVSLVTIGLVYWFLYKYSENMVFSLYLYIALGTYCFTMAAMKQSLAMSFLLLSIPILLKKKWLLYYILVFIATLFHTYAIIWILVPVMYFKPWTFRTYVFFAITLVVLFTFEGTIIGLLNYSSTVGKEIAAFEVINQNTVNPLRVLVYGTIPILTFIFRNHMKDKYSEKNAILVNMSIMSFLIMLLGLRSGANMFARMATYFEIATVCVFPWVVNTLFGKKYVYIKYLAIILYFAFFLYEFIIAKDFTSNYSAISLFEYIYEIIIGLY